MVPTPTWPVVAPDGNETPDDRSLAALPFEPVFSRGTRTLRPAFMLTANDTPGSPPAGTPAALAPRQPSAGGT